MVMYAAVDTIILLRVVRRFLQRQLFSGLRLVKFNPVLGNSPLKDLTSSALVDSAPGHQEFSIAHLLGYFL